MKMILANKLKTNKKQNTSIIISNIIVIMVIITYKKYWVNLETPKFLKLLNEIIPEKFWEKKNYEQKSNLKNMNSIYLQLIYIYF